MQDTEAAVFWNYVDRLGVEHGDQTKLLRALRRVSAVHLLPEGYRHILYYEMCNTNLDTEALVIAWHNAAKSKR